MNPSTAVLERPARRQDRPVDRSLRSRSTAPRRPVAAGFRHFLTQEARALLTRLRQVTPFSLRLPTAPAAGISPVAQTEIHRMLDKGVLDMKRKIRKFIIAIGHPKMSAGKAQKAFALLKLQFNWLLDRMDIFADALSQRGEHETGVFLAGLDALAEDALHLDGRFYDSPPLITYLDRGHGAAIRRARTRLPGGTSNPVAIIRVPRERMISTGIASSIIHEVGHQGASLLELIPSLRTVLQQLARAEPDRRRIWNWYERWISEILSDLWGVATIGIGSSTGLMNVVSVPSYFVFRLNADDPHPPPWLRVKLSLAFGRVLYPDPQWERLDHLWDQLYPISLTEANKQQSFHQLEALIPRFVRTVVQHRPKLLKGLSIAGAFPLENRQPYQLRRLFQQWRKQPQLMRRVRPGLAFAVIGQARADDTMSPEHEHDYLRSLLRWWAVRKIII